jgi:drug/metabolite transporter (DMT)-like permease
MSLFTWRNQEAHTPKLKLVAAYLAVYLFWGSGYLANRFAIETLPPLIMAGTRFTVAGLLLYSWSRLVNRDNRPTLRNWGSAFATGGLFFLGGIGSIVVGQGSVPSGLAALLVATVPLWVALLNWVKPKGVRPNRTLTIGLILGFVGVVCLTGVGRTVGNKGTIVTGMMFVLMGALSWALGSFFSPKANLPASAQLASSIQMLSGGILLITLAAVIGEWRILNVSKVSGRSIISVGYLIVFASLIAFSAYSWLLRVVSPTRASTYAYVNPIVAVLIGWLAAGEPISGRIVLAGGAILTSVLLISRATRVSPIETPSGGPSAVNATDRFPSLVIEDTSRPET